MLTLGIFVAVILAIHVLRVVYSKFCLKNLDVHVSIPATTATEGDVLILTEVLTNNKWLPLPWVSVKFRAGRELEFAGTAAVTDAYYRNDLFHILMHQKITRRLEFTCAKRGCFSIDGLEITAWDVLMEKKYIRKYPYNLQLIVYPGTIPIQELDDLCTRVYGQLVSKQPINPDPFSFRGIREYSSGDPMKAINFKASARGMGLMVNVWDFSNARQVGILLDLWHHSVMYDERLDERAIKIVASVAEKMMTLSASVSFATNDRVIYEGHGTQHLQAILETLALIDFSKSTPHIAETLDRLAAEKQHDPEYWLISPYYSKETHEAVARLKDSGARVAWIMPVPKPTDIEVWDEIIFV